MIRIFFKLNNNILLHTMFYFQMSVEIGFVSECRSTFTAVKSIIRVNNSMPG